MKKTLDLDEKKCVLCENNIPYLNDFLEQHFSGLSQKLSENALFETMHKLLLENQKLLKSQDLQVPAITLEDLKKHFTKCQPRVELIIKRDIQNITKLQDSLLIQKSTPSVVNSYIRISNHKCLLLNKLKNIQTVQNKFQPYKFS
jgi:hypothetical protein